AAFDGDTYYTLDARQRGGVTDDAAEFTLLAWVYLDPVTSASTQTVSSTKKSACSARGGSALLINSWLTQDGCLRAEWSTEGGTCGELSTPASAVAAGQWVHVGYSLLGGVSGPGKAFLYLHGQLIGAGTIPAGRLLQAGDAESQLRVGMQLDDSFGFHGRVAHVMALHAAVTPAQVYHAMKVSLLRESRRVLLPKSSITCPSVCGAYVQLYMCICVCVAANHKGLVFRVGSAGRRAPACSVISE
ncbi:MAG: hypothetical protein P4L40_14690, partial [Terracidiphilus sp.]|nr:hypothetical protein [Terracidiphilus sp.]